MTRFFSALVGIAMGFSLSRIGFSDPAAVRAMFTLTDARLLLTFALAVALLALGFWALPEEHTKRLPSRPLRRGTVLGGLLFGTGWAMCGACPSIVLVQLGEGRLAAALTLLGVIVGNLGFAVLDRKVLRWQHKSCAS